MTRVHRSNDGKNLENATIGPQKYVYKLHNSSTIELNNSRTKHEVTLTTAHDWGGGGGGGN